MLSSKERMLIAIKNGKPDMVPVAPDISEMIPCRLTGRPSWDIYRYDRPPLWKAYIEALRHFKFDGWFIYGLGGVSFKKKDKFSQETVEKSKNNDRMVVKTVYHTPAGDLTKEVTYFKDNPPTITKRIVEDVKEDFPKLKYFYSEILDYQADIYRKMCVELGEAGIMGIGIGYPGFQHWVGFFNGGLEAETYAYMDYPSIFEEWRILEEKKVLQMLEIALNLKPDFVLLAASGTLALGSPDLFRRFGLPTVKKITRICKEANIPTMLHSCGKEKELVKICTEETDLDCINPLEESPMGDCNLKEIKKNFGKKLSLMGNLHTTKVMLKGTLQDVEKASCQAIDDAGKGGGFILSTGDQCGRDTPDENIFRMIEVARKYGRY